MVADFVELGGSTIGDADENMPVLQRILHAICEREVARQGLLTPVDNQLESFQDVAVNYHDEINPPFDIGDLFLNVNGFDYRDLDKASIMFL